MRDKRKMNITRITILSILTITSTSIWAINQSRHSANLKKKLDMTYNRAFYEMSGYIRNVEIFLSKANTAGTKEGTASILKEAWHESNLAQSCLGQLPIENQYTEGISKFLSQVGDISNVLNTQNVEGNQLSDEQVKMIQSMNELSKSIVSALDKVEELLKKDDFSWTKNESVKKLSFLKTSKEISTNIFESVDETFQEYPTLIYDGPFSDHIEKIEPSGLTGEKVSIEKAKEKLSLFIGEDRIEKIENSTKAETPQITTFGFVVYVNDSKEPIMIDVSEKGGHVLWLLNNREVEEEKLDEEKAIEQGKAFLENNGFYNMIDNYYMKNDGVITINYVYKENDIIMYPDMIKLKIAMDTGEIVGFESKGYFFFHRKRELPKPQISEEDILQLVNGKMEISNVRLAIIPTNYKTEIYTYEVSGKKDDSDYLIYINAITGQEEKILKIINTDKGTLTM